MQECVFKKIDVYLLCYEFSIFSENSTPYQYVTRKVKLHVIVLTCIKHTTKYRGFTVLKLV